MGILLTPDEQQEHLEFEDTLRTLAKTIDDTIPAGVSFALVFFDDEQVMPIAFLSNNPERERMLLAIERTVQRIRSTGAG